MSCRLYRSLVTVLVGVSVFSFTSIELVRASNADGAGDPEGEFIVVDSMDDVLDSIPPEEYEETLFLLDIDDTTLASLMLLGGHLWFGEMLKMQYARRGLGFGAPGLPPEKRHALKVQLELVVERDWAVLQHFLPVIPAEEGIPERLGEAQLRGLTLGGLTTRRWDMHEDTMRQLADVGVRFDPLPVLGEHTDPALSVPLLTQTDLVFDDVEYPDARYIDGILHCSPHNDKGRLLIALLRRLVNLGRFKRIVFADDMAKNARSVAVALAKHAKALGIDEFKSYHYTGAPRWEMDEAEAARISVLQMQVFKDTGNIISDDDARARLALNELEGVTFQDTNHLNTIFAPAWRDEEKKTLVVVEVDEVLLRSETFAGSVMHLRENIRARVDAGEDLEGVLETEWRKWLALQRHAKLTPVESELVARVNELVEAGRVVLPVSDLWGDERMVAPAAYDLLHFSVGMETGEALEFGSGQTAKYDSFALQVPFRASMGAVVKAFLERDPTRFERVVYVGSRFASIQDVAQTLSAEGVPLHAYRYGGADAWNRTYNAGIVSNQVSYVDRLPSARGHEPFRTNDGIAGRRRFHLASPSERCQGVLSGTTLPQI